MGANSKIEWCDHTFNPWEGCTKVSPGCLHCYAEARNHRYAAGANWGKGAPRRRTSAANWALPVKWNRESGLFVQCSKGHRWQAKSQDQEGYCPECGDPEFHQVRPRVFCASLADWLDDEVPLEWLKNLLALIYDTPELDWLLLTKRPENWSKRVTMAAAAFRCGIGCMWPLDSGPDNVWVGVSVEDQARADLRVQKLLEIPARVRFLSVEPMLGPVNISPFHGSEPGYAPGIDWVICGGESGLKARPMHRDWALSLRDGCESNSVPFFFKQWGEHEWNGVHVGKKNAGRLLAGREWNEFPEVRP